MTTHDPAADLAERARHYSDMSLEEIARLAANAENESVRLAACRELLDRAHGKAPVAIEATVAPAYLDDDVEIARRLIFILRRGEAALDEQPRAVEHLPDEPGGNE
jgi:hypothetical protein